MKFVVLVEFKNGGLLGLDKKKKKKSDFFPYPCPVLSGSLRCVVAALICAPQQRLEILLSCQKKQQQQQQQKKTSTSGVGKHEKELFLFTTTEVYCIVWTFVLTCYIWFCNGYVSNLMSRSPI